MNEKPYIPSQAEMEKAEDMAADYEKTPERIKEDVVSITDLVTNTEIYGSLPVEEESKQKFTNMAIEIIAGVNKNAGRKLSWTFRLFGPKSEEDMVDIRENALRGINDIYSKYEEFGYTYKRGDDRTEINKKIAEKELETSGRLILLKEGHADVVLHKDKGGTMQIDISSNGYQGKYGKLLKEPNEIIKFITDNL